jgi:two-component system, chemotaxis family, CheB/CheR fusion protein
MEGIQMKSFKIFRQSKQLFKGNNIYRSTQSYLPFIVSGEILPIEQENIQFVQQLVRERAELQQMLEVKKTSELELIAIQHKSSEIRAKIQASLDRANAIVAAIWEPILVIDRDFQIVTANHAYDRMFEVGATLLATASHRLRQTVLDKFWMIPGLRPSLEGIFQHDTYFKNYPVEQTFDRIGTRSMLLSARQIHNPTDEPLILLTIVDTTRPQLELGCHSHEITDPAIGSKLN